MRASRLMHALRHPDHATLDQHNKALIGTLEVRFTTSTLDDLEVLSVYMGDDGRIWVDLAPVEEPDHDEGVLQG